LYKVMVFQGITVILLVIIEKIEYIAIILVNCAPDVVSYPQGGLGTMRLPALRTNENMMTDGR